LGAPCHAVGENVGYGRAANILANKISPDWMVLCNDDVRLAAPDLAKIRRILDGLNYSDPWILGFFNFRSVWLTRLPGLAGVLAATSMLGGVSKRIRSQGGALLRKDRAALDDVFRVPPGSMFPFVCCAISSSSMSQLKGFDPAFKLYFEDADYLRRAAMVPGHSVAITHVAMEHDHSKSAIRDLSSVVPIFCWSAFQYLQRYTSVSPTLGRVLLAATIIVRMGLEPALGRGVVKRLRGDLSAGLMLLRGQPPSLPPWDGPRPFST